MLLRHYSLRNVTRYGIWPRKWLRILAQQLFWSSDVTQSEGQCPLSVHPVVRLQMLIVVCLAIDLLCNVEGENVSTSAVYISTLLKPQYCSCLHIHIIKTSVL